MRERLTLSATGKDKLDRHVKELIRDIKHIERNTGIRPDFRDQMYDDTNDYIWDWLEENGLLSSWTTDWASIEYVRDAISKIYDAVIAYYKI